MHNWLRHWREAALAAATVIAVAAWVETNEARARIAQLERLLRATESIPMERTVELPSQPIGAPVREEPRVVTRVVTPVVTRMDSVRTCDEGPVSTLETATTTSSVAETTSSVADTIMWKVVPASPGTMLEPEVTRPIAPSNVLRPTSVYAAALAAGVGANALFHYDPDRGGYVDAWATQDKWTHFALGALLAQSATDMGVPLRWSVPMTCAGAVGYEASQGYMSWRDAGASCGGALMAAGFQWLIRHGDR